MNHVRAVRVLCQVEADGSFSRAAAALGISQSAVSQHVATLERAVGGELVERHVRPVALTPAGHALVAHGRAVLARLETAEQDLASIAGRRRSRLRLGTFPTALTTFAPPAIARFRATHPDVTLTVVDDHMQRLLPRLRDRELDLALVFDDPGGPAAAERGTAGVTLFDDRYRVVLPRGHRLAGGSAPVALSALGDDVWIGGSVDSTWFGIVRDACRTVGFEPDVALRSDDYHAVLAFAAAGLGVAVVPGLAAATPPADVVIRPVAGVAPARRIAALTPPDAFPSDTVQAMVTALAVAARAYARGAGRRGPGARAGDVRRPAARSAPDGNRRTRTD